MARFTIERSLKAFRKKTDTSEKPRKLRKKALHHPLGPTTTATDNPGACEHVSQSDFTHSGRNRMISSLSTAFRNLSNIDKLCNTQVSQSSDVAEVANVTSTLQADPVPLRKHENEVPNDLPSRHMPADNDAVAIAVEKEPLRGNPPVHSPTEATIDCDDIRSFPLQAEEPLDFSEVFHMDAAAGGIFAASRTFSSSLREETTYQINDDLQYIVTPGRDSHDSRNDAKDVPPEICNARMVKIGTPKDIQSPSMIDTSIRAVKLTPSDEKSHLEVLKDEAQNHEDVQRPPTDLIINEIEHKDSPHVEDPTPKGQVASTADSDTTPVFDQQDAELPVDCDDKATSGIGYIVSAPLYSNVGRPLVVKDDDFDRPGSKIEQDFAEFDEWKKYMNRNPEKARMRAPSPGELESAAALDKAYYDVLARSDSLVVVEERYPRYCGYQSWEQIEEMIDMDVEMWLRGIRFPRYLDSPSFDYDGDQLLELLRSRSGWQAFESRPIHARPKIFDEVPLFQYEETVDRVGQFQARKLVRSMTVPLEEEKKQTESVVEGVVQILSPVADLVNRHRALAVDSISPSELYTTVQELLKKIGPSLEQLEHILPKFPGSDHENQIVSPDSGYGSTEKERSSREEQYQMAEVSKLNLGELSGKDKHQTPATPGSPNLPRDPREATQADFDNGENILYIPAGDPTWKNPKILPSCKITRDSKLERFADSTPYPRESVRSPLAKPKARKPKAASRTKQPVAIAQDHWVPDREPSEAALPDVADDHWTKAPWQGFIESDARKASTDPAGEHS
ncbi:MAG: hypothetical protein M1828_006986 [Chrysothrix sp. TS-e1954]|nr:MAG: hypothetical protein M1828_006986 [Chrysothrix sp. TS-e1954]